MGIKYLWDTNTAIYYLQKQFPPAAEKFIDNLLQYGQPVISAIPEIELLCWRFATESDKHLVQNFINDSLVIELEQDIKLKTAAIRRSWKIKLPDAIIAATAIEYDLILITRNISDFTNIDRLKTENIWVIE